MQYDVHTQQAYGVTAAQATVEDRAAFIMKTYIHLSGAILAFAALEVALFQTQIPYLALQYMVSTPMSWLIVLGLFMGAGFLARWWARGSTNPVMQYAGLGLYVVAEVVIFMPILLIVSAQAPPGTIANAAIVTFVVFGGLTGVVFLTRKDFSFLRGVLGVAALGAMGLIVASLIFGFSLGTLFAGAMVVLASGYILYYTSNVLHHYRTDQYVGAALELFSAVAFLFWYILRLMSRR